MSESPKPGWSLVSDTCRCPSSRHWRLVNPGNPRVDVDGSTLHTWHCDGCGGDRVERCVAVKRKKA